jgi:hypothetical protein
MNILQIDPQKLNEDIIKELCVGLDNGGLTGKHEKKKGYIVINTDMVTFDLSQQTSIFLQLAGRKGYNCIMIKY